MEMADVLPVFGMFDMTTLSYLGDKLFVPNTYSSFLKSGFHTRILLLKSIVISFFRINIIKHKSFQF